MYILGLDLETTGLNPDFNEIIQVGAIILDNELKELSRYESLVKPEHPERGYKNAYNPEEVFSVYDYTGIPEESLHDAPPVQQVLATLEAQIMDTIKAPLRDVVILGQNPKFDYNFMVAAYKKVGKTFPYDYHCIGLDSAYFLFKMRRGEALTSPRDLCLKEAAKCLNVQNKRAHNAIHDVEATVEILRELIYQS